MIRPSAANGSADSHEPRKTSAQVPALSRTSRNAPGPQGVNDGRGGSTSTSASTTLLSTYLTGFSGVSRSWRFQPTPRSTAIDPAAPVADDIAPKMPMLTMM